MPFIGKQGSTGNSKIKKYSFTATASQTAFSVNSDASDELQVFLNGVLLKETDDYTYTTSTVTLGSEASLNDILEVHVYQNFLITDAVRVIGDTMTGELEVPTIKLSSNVIKASDGGSTITLDDSDNVTLAGNLVIPDGGNIGSASDTDAISIASNGKPTFSAGIANTGTIDAGTIGSAVSLANATFPAGHIVGVQGAIATDTTGTDYEFSASGNYTNIAAVTLGSDYSTSVLSSASNKLIVTVTLVVYMGTANASADHWRVALSGTGITDYNAGGLPLNNDFGYKRSDYYKTNMSGTILVTPGQNNPSYGITLTKAYGSTSIDISHVTWTFKEVQA